MSNIGPPFELEGCYRPVYEKEPAAVNNRASTGKAFTTSRRPVRRTRAMAF
jgi:hypothetical protein